MSNCISENTSDNIDLEDLGSNLFKITQGSRHLKPTQKLQIDNNEVTLVIELINEILTYHLNVKHIVNKNLQKYIQILSKKHKINGKIRLYKINFIIKQMIDENLVSYEDYIILSSYLIAKKMRSQSGITEIAVMTMPHDFSCKYDCYYCPNHEGMPRSYDPEGPSAIRARENNFNMVKEFYDRASTYAINLHNVDKVEVIILGGTWDSYPLDYQEKVINELYYAANTFYQVKPRDMLRLEEEQKINETALCKIIGITIETRPDQINPEQLKRCLKFGVTRIQIGIQHVNNKILKTINRQCTIEDAYTAIKLIKEANIKVQAHWMPNLPGSSPELDREMFDEINFNPMLSCDDIKIYPTVVTKVTKLNKNATYSSVIEKWFNEGKYIPYDNETVKDVIIYGKCDIGEEVRISRVFRDIPKPNTISGCDEPNMRQLLHNKMKEQGLNCACLRCHEVKDRIIDPSNISIRIKKYEASNGIEYFISAVSFINNDDSDEKNRIVHGFIRLRIPAPRIGKHFIEELEDCAYIRELHVYGKLIPTFNLQLNESNMSEITKKYITSFKNNQHRGIGKRLLKKAESIASEHGYSKYAIISGVGVREYYKRQGYYLKGAYMIKDIKSSTILNYNSVKNILYTALFIKICYIFYKIITLSWILHNWKIKNYNKNYTEF